MLNKPMKMSSLIAHFISPDTKYFQDRKNLEKILSSMFQITVPQSELLQLCNRSEQSSGLTEHLQPTLCCSCWLSNKKYDSYPKASKLKEPSRLFSLSDVNSLVVVWLLSSKNLLQPTFFPCSFLPHILQLTVHCYLLHCLWNTKLCIIS